MKKISVILVMAIFLLSCDNDDINANSNEISVNDVNGLIDTNELDTDFMCLKD